MDPVIGRLGHWDQKAAVPGGLQRPRALGLSSGVTDVSEPVQREILIRFRLDSDMPPGSGKLGERSSSERF